MSLISSLRVLVGREARQEVRPVIEKHLEPGTVLFSAGEPCPGVALIHEGGIALLADVRGAEFRVGMRGRGEFVGDDAVMGAGICLHTAVAVGRTRIEMLDRDSFLEHLSKRGMVERSSGRVATTVPSGPALVQLAPASPETSRLFHGERVDVVRLPFVVGRASGNEPEATRPAGLFLDEAAPHRLSRRQFTIVGTGEHVGLVDAGSRLGTFVDGVRLGRTPLKLAPGQTTTVIAGGEQSPFRLLVRVCAHGGDRPGGAQPGSAIGHPIA